MPRGECVTGTLRALCTTHTHTHTPAETERVTAGAAEAAAAAAFVCATCERRTHFILALERFNRRRRTFVPHVV